ncbi:MAG: site-specific DNA-methyltransferase [Kiritimatiellae bacterium]|nr:site-specific DNA-methyltransferase [Kiritimatiellia bacterium]
MTCDSEPTVQLRNVDCVEFMSGLSDGFFDLTIADPPYGIGKDWKRRRRAAELYDESGYDNERPSRKCIEEIVRVSKRWIIFGWNYFTDILPPTNYLIVWDKMANANQVVKYSKCEIAATNVRIPCNLVSIPWDGYRMGEETGRKKIHPHQKPVALYRWLLDWYGPGNRDDEFWRSIVFDPFAGSGSLGVACKERGYRYVGCEKSKMFYEAAKRRLKIKEE